MLRDTMTDLRPSELRSSEGEPFDVYEARRSGMPSGLKAALIGFLGCGGCLGIGAILLFTLGAGLVNSFTDSSPVAREFVDAVGEERFEDAWAAMESGSVSRDAFDAALAQVNAQSEYWGRELRRKRTQMYLHTENGDSSINYGFEITYENERVEVDLVLRERDEQWEVGGFRWRTADGWRVQEGAPPPKGR